MQRMPARDITPQYQLYLKTLGAAYSQDELDINKEKFKKQNDNKRKSVPESRV